MARSEEAFPLTNDEVRRRRLEQLAKATEGGLGAIAARAKCSAQNLDHILKRRRQKVRADGTQPLVMLGDKLARDIERALDLAPGWLDWPFMNVDFEAFARLDASGRALIEGQMISGLRGGSRAAPPSIGTIADSRAAQPHPDSSTGGSA